MTVTTFFAQQQVEFSVSQFVPLALGFFGLGTGYLIYGPEELFKFPGRNRGVDLTTGLWGILMPGFLQFVTGVAAVRRVAADAGYIDITPYYCTLGSAAGATALPRPG